ncbi:glycerophosphodiester phosphodiesterase family protein [Planococcus sp. CAU13]|uniref:glycerophosphodiester phosphodiesterase family protein n=1 Tax=Planococcus sp. CAU13 TaxID=1541197 RepID=UPI00052FE3B1|nr:glycerophosphodiester phosphodiesterase family protein [Planococcus sp. CAU13]
MKIYADGGCSGTYPENTLAAFEAAGNLPVSGIKLTVHLTKDREIVVIHDEKVDRTTDGTGFIKDMAFSEVRKLDAGSWFSEEYAGERIPTLDEVFDIFEGTNHRLNIELKTDIFPYERLADKVLEKAEKRDFSDRLLISSFNHEDVQTVSQKKTVESAILTSDIYVDVYDYARVVGTNRIHMSLPGAFQRMATDALRKGAIVYVYKVNEPDYARQLQQIGIHGIFTNFPEKMLAELESPANQ